MKPKRKFQIYGIEYEIKAELPEKIDGQDLPKKDQVFIRGALPSFMEKVKKTKDGDYDWTDEQSSYIIEEFRRCKFDGYWFMCNGHPTYLTPLHYFYLKYYTLENGEHPEYRDVDRRWFYFLDYCMSKGYIKGITRLKKRREGATSQACCQILWTAIFFNNSNCGIVSKTDIDAEKAYLDMVLRAWNDLYIFFKPDHDKYMQKRIKLHANKKKKKDNDGDEINIASAGDGKGHSEVSYRATTLNSYDSGRMTLLLVDEGAKWLNVNIQKYIPIVLKTMMMGVNRVGFCLVPTTMNDYKKGGKNYAKLWHTSDHTKSKGRTQSGLYRYFVPAYDGFPGFIGKYGESIIDAPTAEQLKWLKENYNEGMDLTIDELSLGAKAYLEMKRAEITDDVLLMEAKRADPFTEEEALYDGSTGNYFTPSLLNKQKQRIIDEGKIIRHGRLYEDEMGDVHFADDKDGNWHFLEMPEIPNLSRNINGVKYPVNHASLKLGVDPFRNTVVISDKVSNGTIVIVKAPDSLNHDQGNYPIAFYRGRTKLKSQFYKEVLMACKYVSCKANVERDIDDFYEYFLNNKVLHFLRNTPSVVIDPQLDAKTKEKKRLLKGVNSSDKFALNKELEIAQTWFENNWYKIWFPEIIEDLRGYDHENRTKSDLTVALMMALVDMASVRKAEEVKVEMPLAFEEFDISAFHV